ncbi:MAG: M24 family metallopeptidase [Methanobacteriota archaeon]
MVMSLPHGKLEHLSEYRKVQSLAKRTMNYLRRVVRAGMSEKGVRTVAEEYMFQNSAEGFWYHGVGGFVLAGERSVLSMSGKEYIPSDYTLKETDLVTVDLSPRIGDFWGDYARTLVIEGGKALSESETTSDDARVQGWLDGLAFEKRLHSRFAERFRPGESVSDAFARVEAEVQTGGYRNLDFNRNLGHTIEKAIGERRWFDEENREIIGDWPLFTFEPHIARPRERYGYKHENIYCRDGNRLIEL